MLSFATKMTKTRHSVKSPIEDVEAIVEVLTKDKNFQPGQMHTLGSDETNETSLVFFSQGIQCRWISLSKDMCCVDS